MSQVRILLVEDESIICEDIKKSIDIIGHEVAGVVHSGEEALVFVERKPPELILMDIVLAGRLNGIETAKMIKDRYRLPVVFLTSYSDKITMERARDAYPYGYIVKPFNDIELKETIEKAIETFQDEEVAE
ncbi:response regulator [bacterium]|nr:response regulator [bacterium]